MGTVYVWCGYRADHKSEILTVVFVGERIDALAYAPGGRPVEWTFYRVNDGRCVVQEVRFGIDCDFGVVYIFSSVIEACARFAAEFARVEADLVRVEEITEYRAARAEPPNAPAVTLDEYCELLKAAAGDK